MNFFKKRKGCAEALLPGCESMRFEVGPQSRNQNLWSKFNV